MLKNINTFALALCLSSILLVTGQKFEYLNGLFENQLCPLDTGSYGRCRKILDCQTDFENHRRDKTVLKICSFSNTPQSHLICCSQNIEPEDFEQTTKSYTTLRSFIITTRSDQTSTRTYRTTTRIYTTTTTPDQATTEVYRTIPRIIHTTELSLDFRDQDDLLEIKKDLGHLGILRIPELLNKDINLIDFESCRDGLLKFRTQWNNTNHFGKAMIDNILPRSKENCDLLDQLNKTSGATNNQNKYYCRLVRGKYFVIDNSKNFKSDVSNLNKGFLPNMAAIGWTQKNGKISYRCFGSIITEKFIVTAAHCHDLEDLPSPPTTVRVGDRYLMSKQDDENAQQLQIRRFLLHPSFTQTLDYDDIAMIETDEKIIFNNFVVPSCIGGLDDSVNSDSTVSGYGKDDDEVSMNILMEMNVEIIPNSECNKIYGRDQQLPYGIIDSQICVKSKATRSEVKDTCFGESGSPLQFRSKHDIKNDEYDSNYISTMYETSTLIGIQSFSTSCALDIPSVYTKLDAYREWMRSEIKNTN